MLKKVKQKYLENVRRDKNKNNVFISGIPINMEINEKRTDEIDEIILYILKYVHPDISTDDYNVLNSFEPREGFTRHSCLIAFKNSNIKNNILGNSKKLKDLAPDHELRKVYIKSDQSPLTRKENFRLYNKFKLLRETHKDDHAVNIKLQKGKLYLNDILTNLTWLTKFFRRDSR